MKKQTILQTTYCSKRTANIADWNFWKYSLDTPVSLPREILNVTMPKRFDVLGIDGTERTGKREKRYGYGTT